MHVPDQLVDAVLALPPAARAELLTLLQASLPISEAPGATASDEQLTAEWTEELDRRISEHRSGNPGSLDADAALALVRRQLASEEGASG